LYNVITFDKLRETLKLFMVKASTKTTPSFITELPLVVSPDWEGVLLSRLEAARQMYNACLGEAMKRVKLIRQSSSVYSPIATQDGALT
jgi:hypothetical protein